MQIERQEFGYLMKHKYLFFFPSVSIVMFICFKLVFTFLTEYLHSVLDFCCRQSISLELERKNCYLYMCLNFNSAEAQLKL